MAERLIVKRDNMLQMAKGFWKVFVTHDFEEWEKKALKNVMGEKGAMGTDELIQELAELIENYNK